MSKIAGAGGQSRYPLDTSHGIAQMQWGRLRCMTPYERLRLVCELNRAAEAFAFAGIRNQFPHASDREVFLRFAVRKLGQDAAQLIYRDLSQLDRAKG